MLKEYQLKNFKAFADAAPLLLSPITLLYGPNSAGKSSIIQSLMLLKQTLEESESADVVLLPKGKLVDLGNYREFVHLHEIDRQVSIKVQLDANSDDIKSPEELDYLSDTVSRIYQFLYSQLQEFPTLSLELVFSIESIRSDIILQHVQLWLGKDKCPVITYEKADQGLKVCELHYQHSFWQTWWQEYKIVLPNRVFNQLNKTLEKYNLLSIDRRNQDQTLNELENRQSELLKEQGEFRANHEVLKRELASLQSQKEEISEVLRVLRAQQEAPEKKFEGQKISLKTKINRQLKEKLNSRLINFFSASESAELFIESLEFIEYIDYPIKNQLSRQQMTRKDIQSTQGVLAKRDQKKMIEELETDLKQRLEKCLENFINNLLREDDFPIQEYRLPKNLNEEERAWFTEYQHLHEQLTEIKREHGEVRQPLEDIWKLV
ncbi:MAG: AAA family ATPase [Thermosynechococcaceae cyanobacterium MS004]|nr:AAA family ATPase [Thermosynechococcaceae cyanobacterium MS004]